MDLMQDVDWTLVNKLLEAINWHDETEDGNAEMK
jgi:hypothetical protein